MRAICYCSLFYKQAELKFPLSSVKLKCVSLKCQSLRTNCHMVQLHNFIHQLLEMHFFNKDNQKRISVTRQLIPCYQCQCIVITKIIHCKNIVKITLLKNCLGYFNVARLTAMFTRVSEFKREGGLHFIIDVIRSLNTC